MIQIMELNICLFLLFFSTHFIDVKSHNILDEMDKTLKNLEESVAANKNQMEILSNMVEELRNDSHVAKTCNKCNRGLEDIVVSGDVYSDVFVVKNALTWHIPEQLPAKGSRANYWLAPDDTEGSFILKFDQPRNVEAITLVNTHNGLNKDRGTNEFKVYLGDSESGPWMEVLHDFLDDPRGTEEHRSSVTPSIFSINPKCAQFVKFQIISWYGKGGGLQYFSTCPAGCEDGWINFKNKCYKPFKAKGKLSWLSANYNCNLERAQLASIPNKEFGDFIKTLFSTNLLTGGFRIGPNSDQFSWTDGTPFEYTDWGSGEPNYSNVQKRTGTVTGKEFCVLVESRLNMKWNDVRCFIDYSDMEYLCQKFINY